jgi:hypothetical protein
VEARAANYLDDLRHDLQDEEFAWRYLSACAMESGETLRIGMRDVRQAADQAALERAAGALELLRAMHEELQPGPTGGNDYHDAWQVFGERLAAYK